MIVATSNTPVTTYLGDESIEWLKAYFKEDKYRHLLNRSGEVRLGTALSFIVDSIRLGDVVLPESNTLQSTLPNTGLNRDEVLQLIVESNTVPNTGLNRDEVLQLIVESNTVPSTGLNRDEVLQLIVESNTVPSTGLSRDEVLDLIVESNTAQSTLPNTGLSRDEVLDLIEQQIANLKAELDSLKKNDTESYAWGDFHKFIEIEAPKGETDDAPNKVKNSANAKLATDAALEKGLGEWKFGSQTKRFHKVG